MLEADVVEEEELQLRTEGRLVRDAGGAQVLLRLRGHVPWVARVSLTRQGVDDVADDGHGRLRRNRVDDGGVEVQHEQHVGLLDLLKAAEARSVEAVAVLQQLLVEPPRRDREVLPAPQQVGHTQVDAPDPVVLNELQQLL